MDAPGTRAIAPRRTGAGVRGRARVSRGDARAAERGAGDAGCGGTTMGTGAVRKSGAVAGAAAGGGPDVVAAIGAAGCALRSADAAAQCGIHGGGDCGAGAGHWTEHHDFHCIQGAFAARLRCSRPPQHGEHSNHPGAGQNRLPLQLPRLPRLSRPPAFVQRPHGCQQRV